MSQVSSTSRRKRSTAEPAWEVAHLFPLQGAWCEDEYLALDGNHLVELSNGVLEVPPMPTMSHQLMVLYLYGMLHAYANEQDRGTVLVAPLRVRLWARTFREPDVVFMLKKHAVRMGNEYWKGADLAMEVVSGEAEDRRRDLVQKRREYAIAGINEYWIIDPREEQITVLRLAGKQYVVHGEFRKGTLASSHLLPGFEFAVSEVLSRQVEPAAKKTNRKSKRKSSR